MNQSNIKQGSLGKIVESYMQNHPQINTAARYGLVGAGGFALYRLLQDLVNSISPQEKGKDKDTLNIELPDTLADKTKMAMEKEANIMLNFVKHLLLTAGGGLAGVYGTKALYDYFKRKDLEDDVDHANRDYLATLAKYKQGSENNPHIKELCKQAAEEFEKQAGIGLTLSGLLGTAGAGYLGYQKYKDLEAYGLRNQVNELTDKDQAISEKLQTAAHKGEARLANKKYYDTKTTEAALSTANQAPGMSLIQQLGLGTMGIAGIMTLLLMNQARREKLKKEEKRTIPSNVSISFKPTVQPPVVNPV